MLNSVRYSGARFSTRNVHWLHALAAATSIVESAPSSSSEAKSTAYETDIVDPAVASGSVTLNADATDEMIRSALNSPGWSTERGPKVTRTVVPAASTAPT